MEKLGTWLTWFLIAGNAGFVLLGIWIFTWAKPPGPILFGAASYVMMPLFFGVLPAVGDDVRVSWLVLPPSFIFVLHFLALVILL